ncbi:formylglycine-generating enzyme required for sulfatase activity [Haloferula luteola]|uniref:Formylglycine-generating enzyme required for sulfatase activity n=2 Tax=Haloferula luteola TaxID=595692 RepID=A0A840UZI8_9BACT|nr:formylglycine-generating enzyme required for sulfatase activity [Haloferula luteola]
MEHLSRLAVGQQRKPPIIVPLDDGVTLTFRHIPAGSFRMGQRGGEANEEPVTEVFVGEFWMGETPVTLEQYGVMAGWAGLDPNPSYFENLEDSARRPVEQVSWDDAMAVAVELRKRMEALDRLPRVHGVGLPSEAMWEYACRARTQTEYWSGDGEAALVEVGWHGEEWVKGGTHVVAGKRRPNAFGLHDMHGNVWEWCADVDEDDAYRMVVPGAVMPWPACGPRRKDDHRPRVLRGGSWDFTAWGCRSAYRFRRWPGLRHRLIGFRLCVFPGPVKQGPEARAESATGAKARRDDAAVAEGVDGADLNTNFPPRSGENSDA